MNNSKHMEKADEMMKALAYSRVKMYNYRVQILKAKPDSQDGVKSISRHERTNKK